MKKLFLAAALGATALTGVAVATQVAAPAAPPATRTEAVDRAEQRFVRLDVNKDGQLSAAERPRRPGARRGGPRGRPAGGPVGEQAFARADANGDGAVTREEHRAAAMTRADAMFARLDADKDGRVVATEMTARPDRPGPGGRMGRRAGGGRDPMARADTDGDGNISRAEYRAQVLTRFARVDANNDGRIDPAERAAKRDKRMERRGPPMPGA